MIPRTIAINFIKPYVLRGDTDEQIIAGQGGCYCEDYNVQIGGYIYDKNMVLLYKAKTHEITVSALQDNPRWYKYDLHTLAKEIRLESRGIKQGELQFT